MRATELHLFVNPVAGRGRAAKRLSRVVALLGEAGVHAVVVESGGIGDLEKCVREHVAGGASRLLVAGGDGSIHEAVNGILGTGREAALGVIPSGTGNDFAKAAGIPLDWETATRLLADRIAGSASLRRIDAGRMNERYFANGAGIGLDARVTAIARSIRWPIGDLVYLLAIFRTLAEGIETPELVVSGDGVEYRGPLTLANVSNGPWIGGMFHIAPMANNADGALELLIVDPVTPRRVLALLPKLMRGVHVGQPEIRHVSVTRVVVDAAADVPSHLDGEVQPPARHFEIEVLPDALALL